MLKYNILRTWLLALLLTLIGIIIWQHFLILELAEQSEQTNKSQEQRLSNLEYIINAHSEQLHEHENQIQDLQEKYADLHFRILENTWDLHN